MPSPSEIPGLQYILPIVVFVVFCMMVYFCGSGRYVIRAEERDRRREQELRSKRKNAKTTESTICSIDDGNDEDVETGKRPEKNLEGRVAKSRQKHQPQQQLVTKDDELQLQHDLENIRLQLKKSNSQSSALSATKNMYESSDEDDDDMV